MLEDGENGGGYGRGSEIAVEAMWVTTMNLGVLVVALVIAVAEMSRVVVVVAATMIDECQL